MRYVNRWIPAALVVIACLGLAAWFAFRDSNASVHAETASKEAPARVEPVEGSEFKRVILSQKAAERLDVQSVALRDEQIDGAPRKVVPYDAILYGTNGETWIYTNPEPLVFVRQSVSVERIEGNLAILSEGPPTDTAVAVVAVAELFGAETGWGGSGGH
jgi:hypothetical protein